jgi:hypothetical protein
MNSWENHLLWWGYIPHFREGKQIVCIWGSEHPHATMKHIRDSPFPLPKQLWHPAITWTCWKTLSVDSYMFIQKDGTAPHWSLIICASLNKHFPNQWTGHASSISCPARSLDIMPFNFFSMRICKRLCIKLWWPTSMIWRTEFKLLLQHSTLACCSAHG